MPDRHRLHGSSGEHDIGYRSSNGESKGPGQLFSDVLGSYTRWTPPISKDDTADSLLINAINYVGTKGSFSTYNFVSNNCQDWVTAVEKKYNDLKKL
ncbi:MAG: hypothetical protein FWG55_05165 [Candidatus Bathyarchaeota archaeon]|nr:hypothetical protein [Candidatus Termiticorpusculum sp.]